MNQSDTIKGYREKKGFTQAELAEKMGRTRQTIISWEKGKSHPDAAEVKTLSKLFGVDEEQIDCDDSGNNTETVYKDIVEGNTEYILIPRAVLQEKYRLVSLEQIQKDQKELQIREEELRRREEQISGLYSIIKDMITRLPRLSKEIEKA